MKEKKNVIVGLSTVIVILLIIIICLILSRKEKEQPKAENEIETIKTYGSYLLTNPSFSSDERKGLLTSYDEYISFINGLKISEEYNNVFFEESDFEKYDYMYFASEIDNCRETIIFSKIKVEDDTATIYFDQEKNCGLCAPSYEVHLIAVEKDKYDYLESYEVDYKVVSEAKCDPEVDYKPILYLYPKTEMNINVKLKYSDRIITSYPKYNNGWNVLVKPNGDMYDMNNKYYYALYWDEINTTEVNFSEGFYVTKDNAISFLEEKLELIGLNDRERNEFIMYWLPKLENNEQSLVYFELTDERQNNNELIIEPKPDSLLRINMHIKKVDEKVSIKEQKLSSFNRLGFVAVEWGGTIH